MQNLTRPSKLSWWGMFRSRTVLGSASDLLKGKTRVRLRSEHKNTVGEQLAIIEHRQEGKDRGRQTDGGGDRSGHIGSLKRKTCGQTGEPAASKILGLRTAMSIARLCAIGASGRGSRASRSGLRLAHRRLRHARFERGHVLGSTLRRKKLGESTCRHQRKIPRAMSGSDWLTPKTNFLTRSCAESDTVTSIANDIFTPT
jgi:hypothetical protein